MKKNAFIILAGGKAKRFKNNIPKQYVKIGNNSLLEMIINKIKNNRNISIIVIVHDKKYKNKIEKIKNNYKHLKIKSVFSGRTRQESSLNGLIKIKKYNPLKVIINDACRPFINNN